MCCARVDVCTFWKTLYHVVELDTAVFVVQQLRTQKFVERRFRLAADPADELLTVESPGTVDEIERTRVEIPYSVGVNVVRGDTLVYQFEGVEHHRVVDDLTRAALTGRVRCLLVTA